MTTTAHAAPMLEISAPDAMDLHSDSGLDFGDGDIELDLEPAPPAQHQDDDVSISDAATDAELDMQSVPADQDDFMVDHEDLIEDDNIDHGDETAASHASISNTTLTQGHTLAPPDEDLIDYSDEEDQEPPAYQGASPHQDDSAQDIQEDGLDATTERISGKAPAYGLAVGSDNATPSQSAEEQNDPAQETNEQEDNYTNESEAGNEVADHPDGDDGGVVLQDYGAHTEDEEHKDEQSCESRPITVNYEGNELWLFKQYDTEGSGDFLLEDSSIIHSSMSDFFKACRSCLGEDISHETELGLRFDHLHNMELYEDNTACVAVSLERLLNLYYTLHAQDGNDNPESFYMCLLSRPRFATLLSDVAKHAEQGSGYSGLNSAVAAGETHFADAYSGHSTEHEVTEWENEEEDEDANHHTESPSEAEHEAADEVHQGQKVEEYDDHDEEFKREDEDTHEEQDNGAAFENHSHLGQDQNNGGPTSQTNADNNEGVLQQQQDTQDSAVKRGSQSHSENASVSDARDEQAVNDAIDYTDAGRQQDGEEQETALANDPSTSSSTVQGDEPVPGEASAQTVDSPKFEEGNYTTQGGPSGDEAYENDAHLSADEQFGNEANTESYQDFNQAYDQDDPFHNFQVGGTESYAAEPDFQDYTNQDYAGFEYQDLDQQLQNDFLSGTDFDGNGTKDTTAVVNDFTGTDDFLDLNAPQWVTDQDPSNQIEGAGLTHDADVTAQDKEEEDGAVEQPAVAASSAADLVATSSTDFKHLSPQGQKRSIDEVGDLVDDAPDSIDTKRPRV